MAEADRLVGVVPVVDREGRGFRLVEDLDRAVADLDLARLEAVVDRAVGAVAHGAADADDPLTADVDQVVDHALDDPRVVAQVDEGQVLAVLSTPAHPPAQAHRAPDVGGAQDATEVAAQRRGLGTGGRVG